MNTWRATADRIIADARAKKLETINIDIVRRYMIEDGIPLEESAELYILRRILGALA